MVSLLRRKPKFGFVGGLLRDLLGGGQFAPPMTEFFERFFQYIPDSWNIYLPEWNIDLQVWDFQPIEWDIDPKVWEIDLYGWENLTLMNK